MDAARVLTPFGEVDPHAIACALMVSCAAARGGSRSPATKRQRIDDIHTMKIGVEVETLLATDNKDHLDKYIIFGEPPGKNNEDAFKSQVFAITDPELKTNYHLVFDGSVDFSSSTEYWTKTPLDKYEEDMEFVQTGLEFVSRVVNYAEIDGFFSKSNKLFNRSTPPLFLHNTTTSTHVHISHPAFKERFDIRAIVRVYIAWLTYEPILYLLVDPQRRESIFCSSIVEVFQESIGNSESHNKILHDIRTQMTDDNYNTYLQELIKLDEAQHGQRLAMFKKEHTTQLFIHLFARNVIVPRKQSGGNHPEAIKQGRYQAINFLNIVPTENEQQLGTIEVRMRHGSTDMIESGKWVKLLCAMMYTAVSGKTIPDADRINALRMYGKTTVSLEFFKAFMDYCNMSIGTTKYWWNVLQNFVPN